MKKITIILPDLRGGGAERLHIHLANDWVARGFSVEIVLMQKTGELLSLISPSIALFELSVDQIRKAIWPLQVHFKHSRPDIILSAMWPLTSATVIAWFLSGRYGCLFLSDHCLLSVSRTEELRVSQYYLKSLIQITYPFATGIIAVSQGVKNDLCWLGNLSQARVKVIYNPAATGIPTQIESATLREKLWGNGFAKHILSVGALKKIKDHACLIRAFALLPADIDSKLTILGDGPLRIDLETLVNELGLQARVFMPGFVTNPYPWFQTADLFVLSSQCEGFGNVIVEALECGVPVVSTDCPSGPAEILENGRYGKLVPINDPSAMSSAILASLTTSHDRQALMKRAEDFSVHNISNQYLEYFHTGSV
ncbi:MAG: glycosyltransferase [Magnetococcus sp. THC-1_WYH]